MRHGAAEGSESGKPDTERHLTPEGINAIRNSLPGIQKLVGSLDFIITSPLLRAVDTANIVAEHFDCTGFLVESSNLSTPEKESAVTNELNKLIGKENILLVGHMPYLGGLCRYLVKGLEEEPDLKKGSLVRIYIKGFPGPGEGVLRWIMTFEELKNTGAN